MGALRDFQRVERFKNGIDMVMFRCPGDSSGKRT